VVSQRGAPVYLRDVAIVEDGFKTRETITRLNGEESIVVSVRKQSGTNTLAVSSAVKEALAGIGAANATLSIIIAGDEAEIVQESTDGALEDLLWSSLLATLVILFFFRDLRNTLITMSGLPVIMIATIFFMDVMNISLNQISLLALALVVGLVIDDGIVVRENIMRWIERGYKPAEAASKGTAEVIIPVIATSATILAVFLPVAYAEGIIGKFFRDFGLTVSLAIIVSTFEALTMAPMLSAYFFKASEAHEDEDAVIDESAGDERVNNGILERIYGAILNWTLDHKIIALLLTFAVIGGSIYSARFIEQSFLPSLDRGQFDASLEFPPGTPLAVTEREAIKVESIIRSHPLIADVFTTIGGTGNPEQASFFVKVVDLERGKVDTRGVIDDLRGPLAGVPNMSFQLADSATGGDVLLGGKDIILQMSSSGRTYEELVEAGRTMQAQLAQIPGITDIDVSFNPGKPELQLDIERERIADFGLSTAQIGSTVRTLVNGEAVSTFRGEGPEADIRVQMAEQYRNDADTLLDITMLNGSGTLVPLRNVATVRESSGPSQILRIDRQPTISIGANIFGRDEAETQGDVNDLLATIALPSGIEAKLGGDAEAQADAFTNLGLAMLLAIVFIYMVLASQFASFIQPILIMLAMPLAVIGAILALFAASKPLDLTAFIGFIMLMGLVTKNSILLVDFANRARANGATADQAMRMAGPIRLRPILMTALSLILAMIPVAAGLSQGGEFRQSMSIAIMGGMTTSTFLTLVVVPLAYSMVVGFLDRVSARRRARQEAKKAERRAARRAALERENEGAAQPAGD
jgi:HAE1 family hydrophobic/amphiphilic exporter-1